MPKKRRKGQSANILIQLFVYMRSHSSINKNNHVVTKPVRRQHQHIIISETSPPLLPWTVPLPSSYRTVPLRFRARVLSNLLVFPPRELAPARIPSI